VLAFQATPSEEAESDGSVARVLATLAASGRVESAFAIAERRRARELADRLVQADALRTSADTDRPVTVHHISGAAPITAGDVAAALPDDHTAFLEYVTGPDGAPTTLFVVRRARGGGVMLRSAVLAPADSLAAPIERLSALLESGNDPKPLERALGAAVLDPALALLDSTVTRLVIVPDGPLHRLPFDTVRLPDGRFAIEHFAIGLSPSAAVLAELWRRERVARDSTQVELLAFGDPIFVFAAKAGAPAAPVERDASSEIYRSAFAASGGLPRLAGSGREAKLVARYAPESVVRLRDSASAAYLEHASLTPFRVIHFATHALVDDESMGHTALALSPGGGESGFVTPGDLAALHLRADLVVLSACRTAGGVIVTGEGVQGLTAPLLQAGARAVVATTWRIGDRRTLGFVRALYDALAKGDDVAQALRASKLAALRAGEPPRDWAAFQVIGDPLVQVPLEAPRQLPLAVVIAVLAVLAAGAVESARVAYARTRKRARPEASPHASIG
jgi:CHAT domain-containing protein